jgi:acid stress-induced BolA-like protein IbaG/YrbA
MSEFELHPLRFVDELIRMHGDDITLSFSKYFYRPRSPIDERETFSVPAKEVSAEWLKAELQSLKAGWDLALNSSVVDVRGRTRHIPMIDFIGDAAKFFVDGRSRDIVGHKIYDEMIAYSSGRSLHGYSLTLLSPGEWVAYMARLLLVDFPGEPGLIDHRWIGHRLNGGYSALRWSANSSEYLALPKRFDLLTSGVIGR